MAGTAGRSGRPPLPASLHVARGTFRADRHGSKADGAAPIVAGEVTKPTDLVDGVAIKFWDEIVPGLVASGVATAADVHSLHALCEVWALWRRTYVLLLKMPTDKPARTAAMAYLGTFNQLAARFGLNPSDRQRFCILPEVDQPGVPHRVRDPLIRMMEERQSHEQNDQPTPLENRI